MVGMIMVLIIAIMTIFANDWFVAAIEGRKPQPLIATFDPFKQDTVHHLQSPNRVHWLGLDDFGRDVFSRVIHAGRTSLIVGLCAALMGGLIGTAMGMVAGYLRGRTEDIIMRIVDVLMAFPSLLMGLILVAALHRFPIPGVVKAIIAIGITSAPGFARLVYGATLSTKEKIFVMAARAAGARDIRILRRHITPNIVGEVIVLTSLQTAQAMRVEASLSFIGLGVSPPTPTWGNMIRDGMTHIGYAPWLSLYPGLAILLTVLAFNLMGDGLRDIFDPYLREG